MIFYFIFLHIFSDYSVFNVCKHYKSYGENIDTTMSLRPLQNQSINLVYFYIYKCEGGCLKRAHLANTHSQGFF